MSVFESDTIVFHGTTKESRKKIRGFLQGYNDLFKKKFGKDEEVSIYVGGIPTLGFEMDWDLGDRFPEDEGYLIAGIRPFNKKAYDWGNSIAFLSIFLEQHLCTKITWHQYRAQGCPNCIYMNDSQEDADFSWKSLKFEPGKNGTPDDPDGEDGDFKTFEAFVDGIVKGEQEVEWEEGFSPKSNYAPPPKKTTRMTHRFYDSKQDKSVLAEVVRKVKFGSGERVRYAFKGIAKDGSEMTAFVPKEVWDKFKE